MADRVLVTGLSGYVAGHVAAELVAHGYQVRGTVRREIPELGAQLPAVEQVRADLTSDAGWAQAAEGCRYVVHTASPFPLNQPKDEEELIRPAVDGTLRVLRAARRAGVDRVVLTSSVAAVRTGHDDRMCTEADWSRLDNASPYEKSKTLAERAAWDFVRDGGGPELVALNPGMILGPIQRAATGTSVGVVRSMMARELPGVPPIGFATVDVRDLATAHRLAMELPQAAGNRYICAGEEVSLRQMARTLAARYRIPTRAVPAAVLRVGALFDSNARAAAGFLGRRETLSSARAFADLGWTMRPVAETLLDTADSLVALGVVRDPGRPRRATRAGASPNPAPAA